MTIAPGSSMFRRILARARSAFGGRESGRDPLGPAGEKLASAHLRKLGYRVIGCNLRVPMGEADVLALAPDRETMVLVEVKSRRIGPVVESMGAFIAPPPEASITAHKRAKLTAILRHLSRANGWTRRPLRIDAIAIEWPRHGAGEPTLRHHENAVTLSGDARR